MSPSAGLLAASLVILVGTPTWAQTSQDETLDPTEARVLAFANHFERVVNDRDALAIDRAFDTAMLWDRVLDGFTPALRQSLPTLVGPSQWVLDGLEPNGHIKLLAVRDVNGAPHALFRVVGDAGLNYLDAVITVEQGERVAIVDAYVFASGEMMSQSLHHALIAQWGSDQEMATELTISPVAAAEADRYRRRLDGDPAADLAELDLATLQSRWDDAIAVVIRLERTVGNDPYLDTLTAYFLCEWGSYDRATDAADRALEHEPMLEEARLMRLRVALAQRDFDAVGRSLMILERGFGWDLDDLRSAPAYTEFVRSPAHTRWLLSRQTAHAR
jgi:hypothetical protein